MKFSALISIAFIFGFPFLTTAKAQDVYSYRPTTTRPLRRVVYGAAYRNEVGASATLGKITSANSTTVINLSSSYKKLMTSNTAFGAVFALASVSGNGQNNTYFGLWGTYTYFFDTNWNINNSLFAEAGLGVADTGLANQQHSTVTKSGRQLAWFALMGKNFPIFDKVRFSPKAGVEKIGSTDLAVVIIPLNLTLAF